MISVIRVRGGVMKFLKIHLYYILLFISCGGCGKQELTSKSLASIAITSTITTLVFGLNPTQQLVATGTYTDGTTADVSSSVTWNSSSIATATISSSGLVTAVATGTTNITATFVNLIQSSQTITSNTLSFTVRTAYAYFISDFANALPLICSVSMTGVINTSSCVTTGIASPSASRQITFNGHYAYIVDKNAGSVTYCTIGTAGSLGSCGTAKSGFGANELYGIGIKNSYVYLQNRVTHQLLSCPLNSDGVTIGTCSTAVSSGLVQPYYITINGDYLYATNYSGGALTYCIINQTGGLTSCTTTSALFTGPFGLTTHGNYIYIAGHGNNTVNYCALNTNGSVDTGSCAGTGNGFAFNTPTEIKIIGNYAYITNHDNNTLISCTVNTNGSLSDCASTGAVFTHGVDIAFY